MAPRNHDIAVIPGDGIGPEVTAAAIKILEYQCAKSGSCRLNLRWLPYGSDHYRKHGNYMPADGLDELKKSEAIFFGAVGAQDIPDHISLWQLLLTIRGSFQQYANVRPISNVYSPHCILGRAKIDWMFVRENSEGEYSGHGGRLHAQQDWEVATDVSIYTKHGVRRILRFAFQTASQRSAKHLVVVTKSNALRNGLVMWDEVALEVSREFPDVKWEKELVDAMTVRMVKKPQTIDTVVGTNLHMDILSDLGAALCGSIGVASSSNLNPERQFPSMFEPVHGSAFDITGKGLANPVGAIWSACEMLRWLGEDSDADAILAAVEQATEAHVCTRDMGGNASTAELTDSIISLL
ncbi:tartrate dehydrogenase, partial [Aureobasidium melanogenum]